VATDTATTGRDGNANQKNPWRLFDDHLQFVNQFADPGPVPSKPPAKVTINPANWKDEVDAIERRWQAVVQPTYAVQAIKESAIKGGPKPHGAEKAGAEWGDVIHTLLEAAMKQSKADMRGLAVAALCDGP